MRQYQIRKQLYQGGIALLFLSMLIASFAWSPKVAHAAATASDLSITVQPYPTPFTVYEVGSTMSHVVATGTDDLGPGDPITAMINWGDNTAPTQYTFIDGRTFQVSGSHAYSKVGKYTITVTAAITIFQQSATGTGTITVVPAYTLNVNNVKSRVGRTFSGTIAKGTDPFPNDALKGTINWGDQTTPTSVQVTSSANGAYQINATHTYNTFSPSDSWTITVSLTSIIVGPITGTGTAILAPAFTLNAGKITAHVGQPFQANVATITGTISAKGLLVDIEWGDQTKTSKLSLPGGTSRLLVQGRHTYSQAGSYSFTVIVEDTGTGEQAHVSGTATVR
jgi:PKD repeat protein